MVFHLVSRVRPCPVFRVYNESAQECFFFLPHDISLTHIQGHLDQAVLHLKQ